jgi:PAS domain S-box-containing protein
VGANWDVTTVRNLERSLRASEDRARNVIANAHQAIVTADEMGRITGWNRHAELTFGWSAAEAIGADLAMILPAGQRRHGGVFWAAGFGDDIDQRVETTARRKDGASRSPSSWRSAPCATRRLGDDGADAGHQRTQGTAGAVRERLRARAIGKCLVGLDGSFLKVNPTLCEMVGYSREELLALDFQAITHPDDLDADLNLVTDLYNGVISTYRMDKRYIRKDGSIIWIQLSVSRVDNPDGSPRYFISQIEDLTARRRPRRR